ncbi:MAG TPA: hypothetical protein ENK21_09630 [Trueperaceae bacterium]|nr:hypothetical protein [Trueperaceae bacterium]
MQIIRAKVRAVKTSKQRDIGRAGSYNATRIVRDIGRAGSYNATRIVLDNNLVALVQRHNVELKQGDDVVVAGFRLFDRFMIMAFKNLRSGQVWANNGMMYMIMGLGIAIYPLIENRNYLNYGQPEWTLLAFMALVGGGFAYFGFKIHKAYLAVAAVEVTDNDRA